MDALSKNKASMSTLMQQKQLSIFIHKYKNQSLNFSGILISSTSLWPCKKTIANKRILDK